MASNRRVPGPAASALLVALCFMFLTTVCLAQPPSGLQVPTGAPPSSPTPSGASGFQGGSQGQVLTNLWGMVGSTLDNVATAAQGTDQAAMVENLDIMYDTAGVVGQDIVNYDPENVQGEDMMQGVVGFFENVAQNSDKIYDTTNVALESLTSDERVQTRVTDWAAEQVTGMLTGDTHSAGQGGSCDVEWGANYVGTVLNNGRETLANSEGECCDMCAQTEGCNAWVYCGNVLGCGEQYFQFGQCYLKRQEKAALGQAYERGENVYWTSGVLTSALEPVGSGTTPGEGGGGGGGSRDVQRQVLHLSDTPITWYVNDSPLSKEEQVMMKAKSIQCGTHNLLPGVASFGNDFDMKLLAPKTTPYGPVIMFYSSAVGTTTLPQDYLGSRCGPLDLQIYLDSDPMATSTWGQAVSNADKEGVTTFAIDGVNTSGGNLCTEYVYQYVDVNTCTVSMLYDTRNGL